MKRVVLLPPGFAGPPAPWLVNAEDQGTQFVPLTATVMDGDDAAAVWHRPDPLIAIDTPAGPTRIVLTAEWLREAFASLRP